MIGGLVLLFPVKGLHRLTAMVIVLIILGSVVLGYSATRDNPLFGASYSRIENLLTNFEGGGYAGNNVAVSRVLLADISIKSFLAEPFLGMGGGSIRLSPYVGGHSLFLDNFGAYGLLGGGGAFAGVVLVMLVTAGLRFLKDRRWETLLALTSVVLLVVCVVTNPFGEGTQTVLILIVTRPFWPLVTSGPDRQETKTVLRQSYRHHQVWRVR